MEKENSTSCRTHRVGSITAGMSMIVFGVMLLLHSIFNLMSYEMIFTLWPLILIGLGVELLFSNFQERKIIYDKAAVFILIIMIFFAMGMAVTDVCLQASKIYWG